MADAATGAPDNLPNPSSQNPERDDTSGRVTAGADETTGVGMEGSVLPDGVAAGGLDPDQTAPAKPPEPRSFGAGRYDEALNEQEDERRAQGAAQSAADAEDAAGVLDDHLDQTGPGGRNNSDAR